MNRRAFIAGLGGAGFTGAPHRGQVGTFGSGIDMAVYLRFVPRSVAFEATARNGPA